MKNLVLIGMPGTGKSVVGKVLAQRLNYSFVDVDDLIVEAAGKTLPDILRTDGLTAFLEIEEQVGKTLSLEDSVIATGLPTCAAAEEAYLGKKRFSARISWSRAVSLPVGSLSL